jgi:hypothetical protein
MATAQARTPPDELDVAPLDWADFTAEERAEIEAAIEEVRSGRAVLIPHASVQRPPTGS